MFLFLIGMRIIAVVKGGLVAQTLGDHLETLTGKEFEKLVAHMLSGMGLTIQERSAGADGGVDLIAHSQEPVRGGTFVVQCKRQVSKVSAPVVRDLLGTVTARKANKGILVSTSEFTAAAIEFAQANRIELIDGRVLRGLLQEHMGEMLCAFPSEAPAEVRQFVRAVVSEATKLAERIKQHDYELSNGLVPIREKRFKDLDELSRFIDDLGRRFFSASNAFGNQMGNYLDGMSSRTSPEEVQRRFGSMKVVMDEFLSVQLLVYRVRLITPADVRTYYPEAHGRRLKGLTLLAEASVYFIEGFKRFIHLFVTECSRWFTEIASSHNEFETRWQRGEAPEPGQQIPAIINIEEAGREMRRVSAWCDQKMEEASRFL